MPRPTVVNAKRQPVPPLNLEEMKFWLRIAEEHALFIKAGLPCENIGLINEAETFNQEFAALRAQADRVRTERQFAELVNDALVIAGDFYRYVRRLLHLALTCQVLGCNFALFLDHISRETEYLIRMLDKLSAGQSPLYQVASAREASFWLRLMADHAKFIVHRLDPSERSLVDTAAGFSEEFDELYLQSKDFVSMLRGEPEEIPSFRRFLQDVRVSTLRIRDFNRAAEALISECKLVGIIPALLADHIRREADQFLLVLAMLEKASYVAYDEDGDLEYLDLQEKTAVAAAEEAETPPPAPGSKPGGCIPEKEEDEEDEDEEEERQPLEEVTLPPAPDLDPVPAKQPAQPKQPKVPKYKWNGKWPRPLGSL